jgi:tape measure domain-containing protein
MSSIDERIVEMKFNNSQFEAGVKTSQKSLDDLKKNLNLDGATESLKGLQDAGNRFSLSGLANGVEGMGSRFTALGAVAFGALASIGAKAVSVGAQLASSLTIDPIKQGLDEYNTNLGAIQTVLANTQSAGSTLKDVNAALNELNTYSDKTIYNFSEMAKNIGTFTAAGVDLKTSTAAIKGIANLAALSGSNSDQASTAMYQLSQAISAGRVGLQDWNSVVNAGMGGTVFQRALAQTAERMGTVDASAVKLTGKMKNVTIAGKSFRESLSDPNTKGWLTSKVLTETLSHFTGDMTDAQLAAEGFSKSEIKAIQAQAKAAQQAATVVKTLPQLMDTLRESVGSGWTQTWQYIFGDFDQAKKLFTGVYNTLSPLVQASANARNNVLKDWQSAGGRDAAIKAISNAFQTLLDIMQPIEKAFTDVFPPITGQRLAALSKTLLEFSTRIEMLAAQYGPQIYRTFKGVAAVLDIVRMVVVGVITTIAGLFGEVGKGTGSFLDVTAAIGDFLVKLDDAIKNGTGLTTFFQGLGAVLKVPIALLTALGGAIGDLVSGADAGKALDGVTSSIQPLSAATKFMSAVWDKFAASMGRIFSFVAPLIKVIGDLLGNLGETIANSLANTDYSGAIDGLNTGLFAVLTLAVTKFIKNGFNLNFSADVGGGLFGSIKETFEGLTGTLTAMQQNLKANVLLKIAGALAILTASVVALSLINSADLTKATAALTVMFTQLGIAMALFGKISIGPGMLKMNALATAMILFATAILILVAAVKELSGLDLVGLVQGLGGVIVLLGAVAGTARLMQGATKNLIPAGLGMIAIAVAIKILASSVAELGAMDMGQMIQGLTGVGVALGIIAGFSRILGKTAGLVAAGAGMVLIATSLKIVAGAVSDFGSLDPGALTQGLIAMAAALAIIAGAVALLPGPTLVLTGAGLVIVGAALNLIADAVLKMAGMSWEEIGKGMTVLAGSLLILAGALYLMTAALPGAAALIIAAGALAILAPAMVTLGGMDWANIGQGLTVLAGAMLILAVGTTAMAGALPGAAAMLVVAGALTILTPVLTTLGNMSWDEIGRGLTVLAAAFAIIGVAGVLLTPTIPTLLGLGAAILLLGVGVAAAGVGVLAFSAGLTALGVAGAAGAAGLTVALSAVLGLIPLAMEKIGEGIVAMAGVITTGAPAIVGALVAVLMSLLDAIGTVAPAIINTLIKLVVSMANALATNVPKLVSAGLKLLLGVLTGIGSNVGRIVTAATTIIVNFINAIGKNLPRVTDAGVRMIISFINGLATSIRSHTDEMNRAGLNLATAILEGMTSGLRAGVDLIIRAAQNVGSVALNAIKAILGIHSPSKEFEKVGEYSVDGYVQGLTGSSSNIKDAFDNMKGYLKDLLDSSAKDIDDYTDKILDLTQSVADDNLAITQNQKALDKVTADRKNGTAVKDAKKKLEDLTDARKKDTREIKDARAAQADAEGDVKSAKTTKARKAAEKRVKSAKDRITDLTNKRQDDIDKIKEQQQVLADARADRKSGLSVTLAQNKLTKSQRQLTKDTNDLADAQDGLNTARAENPKAQAAYNQFLAQQAAEEQHLQDLSDSYDDYDKKIDKATKDLDDATKTRDDYNKSIKDQYSALKDITKDTDLTTYESDTRQQITDTLDFASKLQTLRDMHLSDTLYKKFLTEGTESLPFINQVIAQGQQGVDDLNSLNSDLENASSDLGSTASTQLYQAGVDAAAGILKGLQDSQDAIKAQMEQIAQSMVDAVKTTLGIQSPSKEFATVGGYSMDGLAKGLVQGSDAVNKAAAGVGDNALDALKTSMAGIATAVATDMDMQPTIRPVLDLSAVQQGAAGLNAALGRPVLTVDSAYNSVANANDGYVANQQAILDAKSDYATDVGRTTVYNQYNNSPKALSNAEIYRNTKNQLSQAKED